MTVLPGREEYLAIAENPDVQRTAFIDGKRYAGQSEIRQVIRPAGGDRVE